MGRLADLLDNVHFKLHQNPPVASHRLARLAFKPEA